MAFLQELEKARRGGFFGLARDRHVPSIPISPGILPDNAPPGLRTNGRHWQPNRRSRTSLQPLL